MRKRKKTADAFSVKIHFERIQTAKKVFIGSIRALSMPASGADE